jgi:hypothetical protein
VEGKGQIGRPKLRWEDGVMDDARKLGEKSWRNVARNKDGWQKLLRKTWAQTIVPMMMMLILPFWTQDSQSDDHDNTRTNIPT